MNEKNKVPFHPINMKNSELVALREILKAFLNDEQSPFKNTYAGRIGAISLQSILSKVNKALGDKS
jgi:hypothetical protein